MPPVSPLFRQNVAEFRDRFHCWGIHRLNDRDETGKKDQQWKTLVSKGGQVKEEDIRGDPCTCRASHVWNRACPVPKHAPRLGHLRKIPEIKRAVRSSFSPPPPPPSFSSSFSAAFFVFVCLFVCWLGSLGLSRRNRAVPCFLQSFSRSRGKKEKRNKREKEKFYFWKSWYADKVIIFSLSLSLLIFCLVRGSMIYIKIVLYDVGKWLKCIRDWKYKRKLRWSALSDFQTR